MSMFCFQCQETSKNVGCKAKKGTCGKTAEVANLQDLFILVLQGIGVWAIQGKPYGLYDEKAAIFIHRGLFTTITNADFSRSNFVGYIREAVQIRDDYKAKVLATAQEQNAAIPTDGNLPACATWSPQNDEDIIAQAEGGKGSWLAVEDEDIRSLKSTVLFGLKGMSAYADHAHQLGYTDRSVYEFTLETIGLLADESLGAEALTDLALETGRVGIEAMALLDKANCQRYGDKEITEVNLGVGSNPGILVSGHDLIDLEELLEQTKGTGIDIYTHSEMLPAHYYPKLKAYDHLVGNYGNAWYLQEDEFESFNGPVLMTSNCLVPPMDQDQKEKIFTTGAVGFDGCPHIPDREEGKAKDFSDLIAMAKKCPPPEEIESGKIIGGFGHQQVMALADKVIEAVKSGKIKRFVVLAGCDGQHKSRSYYTEVAEKLPEDTIILTAGCAKYRYNKLDLGDIDGIPRLLDAGQCNDCYSLAAIALALKDAFGLDDINDLPISYDIAWYEQKATLVFLSLLYLGIKGIRLGPTLPGFLSPGVAKTLVERFDIKGITTPEADIQAMMMAA